MNASRQSGLVDEKIFNNHITVVGVGGIGSFVVPTLVKMGFKDIAIYDNDTVETTNLPSQFYRVRDIGEEKVVAMVNVCNEFNRTTYVAGRNRLWLATEQKKFPGVLISCVDNMDAREAMFNFAIENPKICPLFIDGRMGRLQAEIYTVRTNNKKDIAIYEKRLWKSHEVDNVPCTEKAIIYNVLFIASMICSQLKLALEGKIYKPAIVADLENTELSFLN